MNKEIIKLFILVLSLIMANYTYAQDQLVDKPKYPMGAGRDSSAVGNGNIETMVISGTTNLFRTDQSNRLNTAYGDFGDWNFDYDNVGNRRAAKTVGGVETRFIYGLSGELLAELDAEGSIVEEIVYLNGEPLALLSANAAESADYHYVHNDHLGTPRKITNSTGQVVWQASYDPFSEATVNHDVDGDGTSYSFNVRFPGQYFDAETSLHYNYFRDYDPSTGRYLQSDPIGLGGGRNTYEFGGGDPMSWIDRYGLAVTNNSPCLVRASGGGKYDEPGGDGYDGIKCVSPGETEKGAQDLVATRNDDQKIEIFKSTDYIDVTIDENGKVLTSTNDLAPLLHPTRLGQLLGGGTLTDEKVQQWKEAREWYKKATALIPEACPNED